MNQVIAYIEANIHVSTKEFHLFWTIFSEKN